MGKAKTSPNYEYFLRLDTGPYRGKWIAIAGNKVAATSDQADEAFKLARKKYPQKKISLNKIPPDDALCYAFAFGPNRYF